MLELSAETAAIWLRNNAIAAPNARFTELGGGVSNKVILAEATDFRAVLKQSLDKLRVEQEWLSDRNRIFREAAALRWLEGRVRGGRVPRLLLEDRREFAIAMQSAPPETEMWKTKLFRGELHARDAQAAGAMLGSIVAASWCDPGARHSFGDQTVFDQLRIDPYYRFTSRRHPDLAPWFNSLIARSAARCVSLVHGDWSPKNLLVAGTELWAIDWEVVHFGDPSFDVAFLLNHLLLKSLAMPQHRAGFESLALEFIEALRRELPPQAFWVESAALEHLPALLLSRVDGKSPVEYLNAEMAQRARRLAQDLIAHPARSAKEPFER